VIDEPKDIPTRAQAAQQAAASIGFALACENRTGSLLRTLAATKPGGRVLELGTGTGVGAAWLLDGMDATARLTTVEQDQTTGAVARQILNDDDRIEMVVADAATWLSEYVGPRFDLAFVDCRPGKFENRELLLRHLAPGAIYVGDDLLPQPTWPADHPSRVAGFLDEIVDEPDLMVTLLKWSSGLVLGARRRGTSTLVA
jgi:predicted O-methyltransferase YrrM